MRDGELLYFTPAEFILMMELSGSGRYSLLQPPDPEPDDCAFLEAFSSLFRRGMLLREEENFRPGGRGSFFSGLRGAPWVVFLSSETELYGAACYVGDGVLWLVELADDLLARRYHPGDSQEHRQAAIQKEYSPLCMMELTVEHLTGKEAIELVRARDRAEP